MNTATFEESGKTETVWQAFNRGETERHIVSPGPA